ncbi:hypothetical protein GCM10027299_21520 [Larkinella ripae]
MAQQRFQSGMLDRKVIPQKPIESRSGSGQEVVDYQDQPFIWANRKDELAGVSEDSPANRVTAISMVTFTIRYRADITVKWRLKSDGDTFDIQHIAPIGRMDRLALRCQRHD